MAGNGYGKSFKWFLGALLTHFSLAICMQGQALANCPLYYTKQFAAGPPVAFPPSTDNTKILEGIKVIEFGK